jgi:fatty acid-binding protein DegV
LAATEIDQAPMVLGPRLPQAVGSMGRVLAIALILRRAQDLGVLEKTRSASRALPRCEEIAAD